MLPELSWRNPNLKGTQPYFSVTIRHIAPVSRMRYGGDPNQYTVFTPVSDLTELDQPSKVTQMIGAENIAKLQQKLAGIMERTETRILRLRADISILPTQNLAEKK